MRHTRFGATESWREECDRDLDQRTLIPFDSACAPSRCQLLTYALRARDHSLLAIDEPDIYLHSDLQRQLLSFLQTLGPDILIATHSTEIVSEVDAPSLLVVNRRYQSAQHVKNPAQLQEVFGNLGSNLNPTLTQLAKTKRAVFVEGRDFNAIALFARKLRKNAVANRADFAVVAAGGFAPRKILDMVAGFTAALGTKVVVAAILDRDYRTDDEIRDVVSQLRAEVSIVHIHGRKEIENYLLDPAAIRRAMERRVADNVTRGGKTPERFPDIEGLLDRLLDEMKPDIAGQFLARRVKERRTRRPGVDPATLAQRHSVSSKRSGEYASNDYALCPANACLRH